MKNEKSALDSFWDIDSLLPKKKDRDKSRTTHADTSTVEFGFSPPGAREDASSQLGTRIPPRGSVPPAPARDIGRQDATSEVLFSYEPGDCMLRRVTVSSWPYSYNFYDKFISDANRYFDMGMQECAFVPYFSYIPQYTQLNTSQLRWYIFWRGEVRRGIYPKTDNSYILLYVYEILNLPERIPPEVGCRALVDVWLAYRGDFPTLDKYLCEWLCDYCLINRLPPPLERLDPVLDKITERAAFREFYLAGARECTGDESAVALSRALVRFASDYNWHKSRALTPENRPLFRRHIPGALEYVFESASWDAFSGAKPVVRQILRDAYSASLCAYNVKRRLDIEYLSFEHSIELRAVVTAIVKYSENRIRAACGLKSRLSIPPLTDNIMTPLAQYFDRVLPRPPHAVPVKREDTPEYERHYDVPSVGFTPENAEKIERESWEVTRMLTPDGAPEEEPTVQKQQLGVTGGGYAALLCLLSPAEREFLTLIACHDTVGAAEIATKNATFPDTLADCINSVSADLTGDILLEEIDDTYAVIDDYIEEIAPLILGRSE